MVAGFGQWVKSLQERARNIEVAGQVQALEQAVREEGRQWLVQVLQQVLQSVVDRRQESLRTCGQCQERCRHQGVRSRGLLSSLGSVKLSGIYWKCPHCGWCQHSVDVAGQDSLSDQMKDLLLLAGVCCTSFDKAQVVSRKMLGLNVDDDAIRHLCLREGWQMVDAVSCPPVTPGQDLNGSCDGTMVNTREDGWRELKALRFEHAHGVHASAALQKVGPFTEQLRQAADSLGQHQAGRCIFVSDCAEWIDRAVGQHLPRFQHVADYFHASQHIHGTAEALYGREHPRAGQWGRSFSRRLREQGAVRLSDRLRRLALFYPDLSQQRAVLDLCKFLDKHAAKMDYAKFREQKIPIDSGPMESFCKQLGLRMKGPGMRWKTGNVTAMARLVSRWTVEPQQLRTRSPAA
jgi:uncharacterized protein YhjY with autotransporter beta-barrel domain